MTFTALAEKINVRNTYLSDIFSGSKPSTESLLFKLESFFQLDNLQQVAAKETEILALQREIEVLKSASVEKFYLERRQPAAGIIENRAARVELNKRKTGAGGSANSAAGSGTSEPVGSAARNLADRIRHKKTSASP